MIPAREQTLRVSALVFAEEASSDTPGAPFSDDRLRGSRLARQLRSGRHMGYRHGRTLSQGIDGFGGAFPRSADRDFTEMEEAALPCHKGQSGRLCRDRPWRGRKKTAISHTNEPHLPLKNDDEFCSELNDHNYRYG